VGAASLYAWLYVLCGLFILALVVLSAVLWRMGKGTERAGRSIRIGGEEEPKE